MKMLGLFGILLGLCGMTVQAASPLAPAEALQILKEYYANEQEWFKTIGHSFTLNSSGTVSKSVLKMKKQTVDEYIYEKYNFLKTLEEHGLVKLQVVDDENTKVPRYKYSVQPTDLLLKGNLTIKYQDGWYIAEYCSIEVISVEKVGSIAGLDKKKGITAFYTYKLIPSEFG
ncbi:MAG TPA: hypothetical protein PKG76_15945, partial [Acidobacteriota bacterium]|nr:hypothetical protein [Acidobacteriota bacterium]